MRWQAVAASAEGALFYVVSGQMDSQALYNRGQPEYSTTHACR